MKFLIILTRINMIPILVFTVNHCKSSQHKNDSLRFTLNPNEDVRHEAGIRIDSLDPLIHRFPDGPESADLSVDSLEDDGLNGFVEIVSLIKFRVSDGSCISSLIKSKGSGVGLADLIIRRSLSVK